MAVCLFWPGDDPVGQSEYRDRKLLASAAGRPFQTVGQKDVYRTTAQKGAALFHSLIANHPFFNGNKRTAVISLDHFLLANGYFLLITNIDMYKLAEETARYREKGVQHGVMLRRLIQTIRQSMTPLRKLRSQLPDKLHKDLIAARRAIRTHRLNHPQPGR